MLGKDGALIQAFGEAYFMCEIGLFVVCSLCWTLPVSIRCEEIKLTQSFILTFLCVGTTKNCENKKCKLIFVSVQLSETHGAGRF